VPRSFARYWQYIIEPLRLTQAKSKGHRCSGIDDLRHQSIDRL
jgi:hypothetical protein